MERGRLRRQGNEEKACGPVTSSRAVPVIEALGS